MDSALLSVPRNPRPHPSLISQCAPSCLLISRHPFLFTDEPPTATFPNATLGPRLSVPHFLPPARSLEPAPTGPQLTRVTPPSLAPRRSSCRWAAWERSPRNIPGSYY